MGKLCSSCHGCLERDECIAKIKPNCVGCGVSIPTTLERFKSNGNYCGNCSGLASKIAAIKVAMNGAYTKYMRMPYTPEFQAERNHAYRVYEMYKKDLEQTIVKAKHYSDLRIF